MEKNIYSCDRCKKEVQEHSELAEVKSEIRFRIPGLNSSQQTYELCFSCCEKLGFVTRVKRE
jgi:hypothetical protein